MIEEGIRVSVLPVREVLRACRRMRLAFEVTVAVERNTLPSGWGTNPGYNLSWMRFVHKSPGA